MQILQSYRRSGPFIRLLVTVKYRLLQKMKNRQFAEDKYTICRGPLKVNNVQKIVREFSETFRKTQKRYTLLQSKGFR